jgi:hypothetical protein
MTDRDCLAEALKELGYPFEEHQEAQHLYGYQGDKRQQMAHIIVRRQHVGHAANDVGFLRTADGKYEMIISEYDQHAGDQSVNFTQKLVQIYGMKKTIKQAVNMGYTASEPIKEKGKIKLRLTRY